MGHILYVDDDHFLRDVVKRGLEQAGHRVSTAIDGAEGLAAAASGSFDAVVTGLEMPRMGGVELARRLRELHPGLPVVILTGAPDLDTARQGIQIGVVDYLVKPVDIEELQAVVDRVLATRRLELQNRKYYEELERVNRVLVEQKRINRILTSLIVAKMADRIGIISASVDTIAAGYYDDEPSGGKEAVDGVRSQVSRLRDTVCNFSDILLLDEGERMLELSRIDPAELVRRVAARMAARIEAGSMRLETTGLDGLPEVEVDPELIERAVEQLVANALRHGRRSGRITICGSRQGDDVRIGVIDEGLGFDAGAKERVFDLYARESIAAQEIDVGAGLGLPFVRLAVEAHGGAAGVEPRQSGCEVFFTLPAAGASS